VFLTFLNKTDSRFGLYSGLLACPSPSLSFFVQSSNMFQNVWAQAYQSKDTPSARNHGDKLPSTVQNIGISDKDLWTGFFASAIASNSNKSLPQPYDNDIVDLTEDTPAIGTIRAQTVSESTTSSQTLDAFHQSGGMTNTKKPEVPSAASFFLPKQKTPNSNPARAISPFPVGDSFMLQAPAKPLAQHVTSAPSQPTIVAQSESPSSPPSTKAQNSAAAFFSGYKPLTTVPAPSVAQVKVPAAVAENLGSSLWSTSFPNCSRPLPAGGAYPVGTEGTYPVGRPPATTPFRPSSGGRSSVAPKRPPPPIPTTVKAASQQGHYMDGPKLSNGWSIPSPPSNSDASLYTFGQRSPVASSRQQAELEEEDDDTKCTTLFDYICDKAHEEEERETLGQTVSDKKRKRPVETALSRTKVSSAKRGKIGSREVEELLREGNAFAKSRAK
jgi:hypothetical protein